MGATEATETTDGNARRRTILTGLTITCAGVHGAVRECRVEQLAGRECRVEQLAGLDATVRELPGVTGNGR